MTDASLYQRSAAQQTAALLARLRPTENSAVQERMRSVLSAFQGGVRDRLLEDLLQTLIESHAEALATVVDPEARSFGRLAEGRAMVLIGESGAGKTRALQSLFNRRPEFAGLEADDPDCPLISITAPSPSTLRILGLSLLYALGYPLQRQLRENQVWELVRHHLRTRRVCFVHIDELQHVLQTGSWVEVQKVRDTLKGLMQMPGWPVSLILSGLPAVAEIIEDDIQIRRRSQMLRFGPVSMGDDGEHIRRLLDLLIEKRAGLSRAPDLDEDFHLRLVHASGGQFGSLADVVHDAIREAFHRQDTELSRLHFIIAYGKRSGCPEDQNVFLTEQDWSLIDVGRAIYPERPQEEPAAKKAKKKKRGSS